jgi:hypothetical protein
MGSPLTTQQQQEVRSISGDIGLVGGVGTAMLGVTALKGVTTALHFGTVVPILDIVAVAGTIASLIFKGADPRQVPASKIEQVFEAAADKINAAKGAGMITRDQASALMDQFIQMGDQVYQQNPTLGLNTGSPGGKGIANMTSVIQAEKNSSKMQLPDNVTIEINPDAAKGYYPTTGTSGWYSESISAADQVASQALAALPKNFPTVSQTGSEAISELTSGNFSALGQTIQKSSLFVWGGILLVGFGLWKVMGD